MRLQDKIALITGGGTGIGRACAELFCREGAKTVIFGRRKSKLKKTVEKIENNITAIPGDITNQQDIKYLVDSTLQQFGKIDILINNAGTYSGAALHEMPDSQWNSILNTNLNGPSELTRHVLPSMLNNKSGCIVHICSVLGVVGFPRYSAYSVSKAGLLQFSRSIAVEYGNAGIRSNAVCPGLIQTNMTAAVLRNEDLHNDLLKAYPLGRFGEPEDIAQACLFLSGDEASFITGATLTVDGGFTSQ